MWYRDCILEKPTERKREKISLKIILILINGSKSSKYNFHFIQIDKCNYLLKSLLHVAILNILNSNIYIKVISAVQ